MKNVDVATKVAQEQELDKVRRTIEEESKAIFEQKLEEYRQEHIKQLQGKDRVISQYMNHIKDQEKEIDDLNDAIFGLKEGLRAVLK